MQQHSKQRAREPRHIASKRPWGRRIVVDSHDYQWRYTGGGITVRGPQGGYHQASLEAVTGSETVDWAEWDNPDPGVTPFDVANWIRVNLLGGVTQEPPTRTRTWPPQADTVSVPLPQQDVYLVIGERCGDDGRETWIAGVTLDPRLGKEFAARLTLTRRDFDSFTATSVKLMAALPSASDPVFRRPRR